MPTTEIAANRYLLTPGRYVAHDGPDEDASPFERVERVRDDLAEAIGDAQAIGDAVLEELGRLRAV